MPTKKPLKQKKIKQKQKQKQRQSQKVIVNINTKSKSRGNNNNKVFINKTIPNNNIIPTLIVERPNNNNQPQNINNELLKMVTKQNENINNALLNGIRTQPQNTLLNNNETQTEPQNALLNSIETQTEQQQKPTWGTYLNDTLLKSVAHGPVLETNQRLIVDNTGNPIQRKASLNSIETQTEKP